MSDSLRSKSLWLAILLSSIILLSGCRKNEFKVEFKLPENTNNAYTLVYYASDPAKGRLFEQVVPVQKGKARMVLPANLPAVVYIMAPGSRTPAALFYAERGNAIKITGESPDPVTWSISGNRITDELTRWRLASVSAIEEARNNSEKGIAKLNTLITKYVSDNPNNPAGALLLLTCYNRRADEEGFRKAMSKLKEEAAEQKWIDLVGRTDMWNFGPLPDLPKDIVVKSFETGCDTIHPGKTPILLYFSYNNSTGRRSDIDSIRQLIREMPDSSSRVIANIYLENDSMSTRTQLRMDSLKKTIHGWMPLGISDPIARQLGITRLPYVVVIGKNGNALYRGQDISKALHLLRRESK